ncbi:MAG: PDZ domain-containing protein [Candidatus Neomarinimicrobiota bacterium]
MKPLITLFLSFLFMTGLLGQDKEILVYKYGDSRDDEKEVRVTSEIEDGLCTLVIVKDGETKKITFPLDSLDIMKEFGHEFEMFREMDVHRKTTWLGVRVQRLSPQLRDYFDVKASGGVLVSEVVEESPAEKAGLKAGDVIISVDREEIEDTQNLTEVIRDKDAGEEVSIRIVRDGRKKKVEASLESRSMAPRGGMRFFAKRLGEHDPLDLKEDLEILREEMNTFREELKELRKERKQMEKP